MAFEITKVYTENAPALRFIGKRYGDGDRVGGSYGAKWGEWFQNGWFGALETLHKKAPADGFDWDSYIGLMRCGLETNTGEWEYWIGMFRPAETPAPDGFEYLDIPPGKVGVTWVRGKEDGGEIYGEEPYTQSLGRVTADGSVKRKIGGFDLAFERYNCPRFTEKDAQGNVTLDYGFYLV